MRLGIDAHNQRAGGALTHLKNFVRFLRPEDHGITEIVVWSGQRVLDQLAPDSDRIRLVHEPWLDGNILKRTLWRNTRLERLAREGCDLLFAPGGLYKGRFRPCVAMSRNMLPFESAERGRYGASWTGLRLRLLRGGQERTFRNATGFFFLSEYAREFIVGMGACPVERVRTTVIPHGFNRDFLMEPRPQLPISEFSPERPFRILYVSIIDTYKHQWHVADAVKALRDQGTPVVLDLVGPAYGPSLSRLRQKMKDIDPQGDFIRYHGAVPYSDLPDWYREANLFVFASSCENMPNILVEAMAAGLPIACSNRGPMPEVFGSSGPYFDPESPAEITATLRELIDDVHVRRQAAKDAHERVSAYDWQICANATAEFLVDVAREFKK
jgi:glycosyltransferase involved in cell wall biosynthesis